jgi:hypothetical protein
MIAIKRGDTLGFYATLTDTAGEPLSGKAELLRSQVRTSLGALVAELTISEDGNTPGRYFLRADTAEWPTGMHRCDIELADGGVISSTETFEVLVKEDVTRV